MRTEWERECGRRCSAPGGFSIFRRLMPSLPCFRPAIIILPPQASSGEQTMIDTRDCDWLAEHGLELSARCPGPRPARTRPEAGNGRSSFRLVDLSFSPPSPTPTLCRAACRFVAPWLRALLSWLSTFPPSPSVPAWLRGFLSWLFEFSIFRLLSSGLPLSPSGVMAEFARSD